MRRCPKCSLTFDDSSRICRSCGAILDDVTEETLVAVDALSQDANQEIDAGVEEEEADDVTKPDWTCPQCGESVPGTFALCWNCSSESPADVDSAATPESVPNPDEMAEPIQPKHCVACGSSKIVPNTTIVDQGQHSSGHLCVVVAGEPDAIFFKHRLFGTLTADICGDCGNVNIRVHNPGELYEHYLQSQQ